MSGWHLASDWPAPIGVHAFTTLRYGLGASLPPFDTGNLGLRNGDDGMTVRANRAALRQAAGLPSEPRWLQQVHGTGVVRFEREQSPGDTECQADAAVSSDAGVVLAILSADCLPVVFTTLDGNEIAAAHAGWRGLAAGVLEATVAAMETPPERVMAWLGPAAGPETYEVDAVVRDAFIGRDAQAHTAFVPTREGHWRLDLYAIARQRLHCAGVTRVYGGGLCTISDAHRFFSHRREARTGRMATLIWREA